MIQLLVLLLITAGAAVIFKIRIEKMLPVSAMVLTLAVYTFGLFTGLVQAVFISYAILLAAVVMAYFVMSKKGTGTSVSRGALMDYVLTPQIIVLVILGVVTCIAYSGHRVIQWDDLNVWGIYPKTLFNLNRIPTGLENCSMTYKDYQPVQQIMQYIFMLGEKSFNEAQLFRVNVCFMYVLLMPVLEGIKNLRDRKYLVRNACAIAFYVMLPHIFSAQFYGRLGVDYLIALLFGYGLYLIWQLDREKNLFLYVSLSVCMSYLSLIKSSGIVLVLLLLVALIVVKKINISLFATGAFPVIYYLSWKMFAKRTGNTGYLSQAIDSNIKGAVKHFPEYTGEVLVHYVKNIFAYPLTRENIGITAFIIVLIIVAVQRICKSDFSRKLKVFTWTGFVLFCIGHIYMYLFVFDDWEAHGLLEFDRYIGQYLGGLLVFSIAVFVKKLYEDDKISDRKTVMAMWTVLAVFIVTFPYRAAVSYLIPVNYEKDVYRTVADIQQAGIDEWSESGIRDRNIPNDENNRIMVVTNAWDDSSIFMMYEAVPQVLTCYANVPAIEPGNLHNFISGQLESRNIKYVYVASIAEESFQGDFSEESSTLTDNGESLHQGLYVVDENYVLHRMD